MTKFWTKRNFVMIDFLKDMHRYRNFKWISILFNPIKRQLFYFRLGNELNKHFVLRKIIELVLRRVAFRTGIQLELNTMVGGGLFFPHHGGIVINSSAVIGNHCTIFQNVTIGSIRGRGAPVIGDNVVLAAGCKIIGKIVIGDNVFVAPNSVCVCDIPSGSVAAGIPAKVISEKGRYHTELYSSYG